MPVRFVRPCRRPRPSRVRQRAILLIELLVAMAVIVVLVGLAAPSFQAVLSAQRVRSAAHDLQADLFWARGEAIRRHTQVVLLFESGALCPSLPPQPRRRCAWRVFADANGDRMRQPDEAVLRTHQAVQGVSITFAEGSEATRFDRLGNNLPLAGSYTVAPARADAPEAAMRTLCMSAGGRLRTANGSSCAL